MIRKSVSSFLLLGHAVLLLVFYACCCSPSLNPEIHPRLSLLGLGFPVMFLLCLGAAVAWFFLFRRRRMLMGLLAMLPAVPSFLDYCPLHLLRSDAPAGSLKIISWNTHNYGGLKGEDGRTLAFDYLANSDADIICIQEGDCGSSRVKDEFCVRMDSLGYEHSLEGGGLNVYSKLPILSSDTLVYSFETGRTRVYRLLYEGDTLFLINNHLETSHLSAELRVEYKEAVRNPDSKQGGRTGKKMVYSLTESARLRGAQTNCICDYLDSLKRAGCSVILCGDFNETPISYPYRQINRRLKNAFAESGRGLGLSFNMKLFPVRIDHLFYSSDWQSYQTFVDRSIAVSDHYPLVSWLKNVKK